MRREALKQQARGSPATLLPEVRVQGRAFAPATETATETATVGGLSGAPLAATPQSITVIRAGTVRDLGAGGLSGAIKAETSASDAYNTVELPAYGQRDTAFNLRQRVAGRSITWRVGVDNALDKRYWKDAPTQYWGGVYLFPAYPRTFSASVQIGI